MYYLLSLAITLFLLGGELTAAPSPNLPLNSEPASITKEKPVLLAQSKRRSRKKILTGEARTNANKTEIDFEAASIDGERRAPVGVAIGSNKQDHGYDLINLRLRWHPEMIKSTSNLETGKGR